MSGEEPIKNVLRRFSKHNVAGVMAGEPGRDKQPMTSGIEKGKKPVTSFP